MLTPTSRAYLLLAVAGFVYIALVAIGVVVALHHPWFRLTCLLVTVLGLLVPLVVRRRRHARSEISER